MFRDMLKACPSYRGTFLIRWLGVEGLMRAETTTTGTDDGLSGFRSTVCNTDVSPRICTWHRC